jgi:predicted dehydrogenase
MASLLDDLPSLDVSPGPRNAEPLPDDRPVRWGFLATGKIARSMAKDLALVPEATLAAVASRRSESAKAFADEHGAAAAYGSYEELVADPSVDVVYVASPHALHREHTMLALEAGKPVLCEKALTLNAREAEELVATARARNLFLMEAMWMRCNPVIRRLQQLAEAGRLGNVRQVRADLGSSVDVPESDRMVAPELGGGALLDMGIYPLTFASLFLGEPDGIEAVAAMAPTGIDLSVAVGLVYRSGAVASVTTTMAAHSPRTASIATDVGRVDLPGPFHHPQEASWVTGDHTETISEPVLGTGLAHEVQEVVRCLRSGETESPMVPLDDTLALMRQLDRIRERIGLRYQADER